METTSSVSASPRETDEASVAGEKAESISAGSGTAHGPNEAGDQGNSRTWHDCSPAISGQVSAAFRSLGDAVIIMLNLPLALIGGAAGVFVSGGVLSVASIIGFIALFGIATRNGIMMISHIRHLLEEKGEKSFRRAVVRGARERVVPILMTALSAGLALVPLALAGSHSGAELEAPMAVVILFGLLSATALNMIVVPIAYLRFSRQRP